MQEASRSWERQGNDSPPGPADSLILGQIINLKSLSLWQYVTKGEGKIDMVGNRTTAKSH